MGHRDRSLVPDINFHFSGCRGQSKSLFNITLEAVYFTLENTLLFAFQKSFSNFDGLGKNMNENYRRCTT